MTDTEEIAQLADRFLADCEGTIDPFSVVDQFAEAVCTLHRELNTPSTVDFLRSVQIEAAHQRQRWGVEHDAGKRPEDWIALVVYLLGKATKAHYDGDREKLLHHVITLAAVAANWHANATGEDTRMRPGVAP